MSPRLKGLLIALTGTTAWSLTGIFIDYLMTHFPLQPLVLAFWRDFVVAATLFVTLRLFQPQALNIARADLAFFGLYGFIGLAVFNSLWTYSVRFNGAAVATVLAYSSPAFTVLLARLLLRERLTLLKIVAVGLSLAGCVLVAEAYMSEAWRINPAGIVVGLATGLAFAFYSLAGRWSSKRFASAWTVTTYGFAFATIGLGVLASAQVLLGGGAAALGPAFFSLGSHWDGWLILLVLAIGPSLGGFGLYTLSLRYLPASAASLVASLEPALTALIAMPVLGQYLNAYQWFGAGLILVAVILAQSDARPEQSP